MQTYLFAWNPSRWDWEDIDKEIQKISKRGYLDRGWSAGNRKNIPLGSRFFLIRLGSGEKGIIGSGVTTSEPYYDESWDQSRGSSGGKALYVNLRFDHLSKEPLIKWQELETTPLSAFHWSIQASGIHVSSKIASSLESLWRQKTKNKTSTVRANPQCWIIKTTEGGPGYPDHWDDFQSEKVVAVGWPAIKYDPAQFESFELYLRHLKSKYKWDTRYGASTIYKFAHEWQAGDIAIICTGYAANQTKDVYLYGIAKIGRYYFDKSSSWWSFKRNADITLIERNIPIDIFKKTLGGSLRQTIHGPFSDEQFQKFKKAIGIRYIPPDRSTQQISSSKDEIFTLGEIQNTKGLPEGAAKQILVNAYERNPKARRQCIAHYGTTCYICDFDFLAEYGKTGEGFIQVHHLKQLSEIGKQYKVDPIAHLRPVCPNCHAIIHRRKRAYTIKEVKSFLRQRTK